MTDLSYKTQAHVPRLAMGSPKPYVVSSILYRLCLIYKHFSTGDYYTTKTSSVLETFQKLVIFTNKDSDMESKKCGKCDAYKPINEFNKNSSKPDGLAHMCKTCHSEYRRQHYLKNKVKVIKQVNRYREENPDKYVYNPKPVSETNRIIKPKKHHSFNKKAGRIYEVGCHVCNVRVFASKSEIDAGVNKFCSNNCRSKLNKSNYHHYLRGVKKRAKKKGFEIDLTEEFLKDLLEVTQKGLCSITNTPIIVKHPNDKTTLFDTASLDRVDSNEGYVKGNVQWVMLGVNYMKMKFSNDELHKTLRLIKENYRES